MTVPDDAAAIELLTAMLRIPSLTRQEDALARMLVAELPALGLRNVRRDDAGNVLAEAGSTDAEREVVLLGHLDTVPGEINVELQGDLLFGRGAVDAKGPLATAFIAAARAAERASARLTVIGAVQEEGPSVGARHLTNRPAPDALVILEPGGWDSVVLGYKGSQRFTVQIDIPNGHTAGPETSAPERAIAFWNRLVTWCESHLPPTDRTTTFDRLTATLIAMNSQNNGLRDTASLTVGLRLPPGPEPESIQNEVRSLYPDAHFDFAPGEPAVRGEKTTPLVAGFLRAIRSEGGRPRFKVKTGTSDMNVVGPVWGCPMVAYGPGDSKLDHTPEEHIVIDEYLRAVTVLTHVLEGA